MVNNRERFDKVIRWSPAARGAVVLLPDSGDVRHHPFDFEVAHLVDCIVNDKESHANVADAYKTHEVVFAADLSGKEGKPVKLPLP